MAIARKGIGAGSSTETSSADLAPVCPAVVDANDILLAQILYLDVTTTPSTPSGWDLVAGPYDVGTTAVGRMWAYARLADGSEDGDAISFGTAGGTAGRAGRIYSFSGYVSGTITDLIPSGSVSGISHATDPQGPTVLTDVAGALAVALTCQNDNNTEEAIAGMSGGTWADFQSFIDANLGAAGLHIDYQACIPTADPGTVSGGATVAANDPACTIGLQIRPSAPVVAIFLQLATAPLLPSGARA
jgi:hypothetical protein